MRSIFYLCFLFLLLGTVVRCEDGDINSFQTKDMCQRDSDCANKGTCKLSGEHSALFNRCDCKGGFGGDLCDTYCPLKCLNGGSCRPKNDDFECVCHGRWTGDDCHIPFIVCEDHTMCLHGGTCVAVDAAKHEFGCNCPPGFDGSPTCALNPNVAAQGDMMSLQELEHDLEEVMTPKIILSIVVGLLFGVSCTILAIKSCSRHRGYRLNVNAAKFQTAGAFDAKDLQSSSLHDISII